MGGTMSIVMVGSTSGSITLQEPAVAGSTVLSLPAVTGTILTDTAPKAGNVIQVVQATVGGSVISTTSTSFVSTGFSASITPASSSSKILISVNLTGFFSTVANTSGRWTIFRGSTNIAPTGSGTGQNLGEIYASAGQTLNNSNTMYLDSPNTTSSTTYTIHFASNNGNNIQFQPNNQTSTIILMEIAG